MPRFAILRHDHPAEHWDLFLEAGSVLRSWRLLGPPVAGAVVPAEPTPDHRLLYLDYEGPVSGDRGTVTRYDTGTFTWEIDTPGGVVVRLTGAHFVGRVQIQATDSGWTCTFEADPS
jgi:DNA polymerase Ligase (LigD)